MPAFSGGLTRGLVAGGTGQGGVGPMGGVGLGGVAGRLVQQVLKNRKPKKPGGMAAPVEGSAPNAVPGAVDPSIFGTGRRY